MINLLNLRRSIIFVAAFLAATFLVVGCKQKVSLGSEPLPIAQNTVGAAPLPNVTFAPSTKETPENTTTETEKKFECCLFPLDIFPSSYPFNDSSIRAYNSNRDGGARKHAAADLYHIVGEPIYAIDDGEVLATYEFYSATYAVEVQHPGFIIRYGEVRKQLAAGVSVGAKVRAGQVIAYVGQMKCCRPMLHFEMFTGSASGPLTNLSNPPFLRRSDLVNPTSKLLGWQNRLPR